MTVNVSLPAAVTVATTGAQGIPGPTGATGPAGPQGPAGSSGGTSIKTVDTRVTVENIALASSNNWTIVTSSGSVPLQCSIPAAAGDRITASLSFMRTGSSAFLDVAILDSTGAISTYFGSGTSTPLAEGAPAFYPQAASFPASTGPMQFTVASNQVNGSGKATIALVYKGGGGSGETIYASATYPFYMLLINYGPAPS